MNMYPDLLDLYSELSPTENELLDRATEFVTQHVLPTIHDLYEKGEFPVAWIKLLGDQDLLGVAMPQEFGGLGLGGRAYGLLMQALERGDSGLRSFVSVQGALVQYPILQFGSTEQKRTWLPGLIDGSLVGGFALTEPDFGSDPGGMQCIAEACEGGYVLQGAKKWITNGPIADVILVWARLEGRIRGFLVPGNSAGCELSTIPYKLSLRASLTSEMTLEQCRVDAGALLPDAIGLKAPLSCLMQARYGIAWGAIGAASQCLEVARDYSIGRQQFGGPMANRQLIQQKLANMLADISHMQSLCFRLADLKDRQQLTTVQVSLAKRDNVRQALEIARNARDILGANGTSGEYPVMRHMLNLETVNTYEGAHDIHTLVLGHHITGLDAFR